MSSGAAPRVLVDDVFELAAALDVSPLYLLTPTPPVDEAENALKVWIGGKIARWPHEVRQWVRGVRPLLDRLYDESGAGRRFYLLESQSLGEWQLIRDAGEYANRVRESIALLSPSEEERQ